MAVSLRLIRARVRSIKNTKKITKAMELVSAAKMRKAVAANLASRAYSQAARAIIQEIAEQAGQVTHPLMEARSEVKRVLMVVFTSDRGLCGSFNAQVIRAADAELRARRAAGQEVRFISVGKRGAVVFKQRGVDAEHMFTELSNNPISSDVRPVAKLAIEEFLANKVDEVVLVYSDFKSALIQTPKVERLLPLVKERDATQAKAEGTATEYLFEPDQKTLLETVVPRLVETLLFQALLESNASEHSARMMNMKNATSNASDMIDDLTLMMNQMRQAGITREISEISAGKAALE